MIQDIGSHRFYNEYNDHEATEDDIFIIYMANKVLMKVVDDQIKLPKYKDLKSKLDTFWKGQYLFEIDDRAYYLGNWSEDEAKEIQVVLGGEWSFVGNSEYRYYEPTVMIFACSVGEHLARWYQEHRYCSRCGNTMRVHKEQRALECPKCGKIIYPVISPCVIVAVYDGERLLLTRYANRPYRRYALVGGYCEVGETVEETVHREVFEETGLRVKNLKYYKCQPWGFSDSLLFGFFAQLDGDDKIVLQEDELAEGTWFHRDDIPETVTNLSLTNEMIEKFRKGDIE